MKREDVDDFLRAQHAPEVVLEVIRILEDLAAGGAGNGEEAGVGVEVRSRLVVLHAHALDVDGVKHDVRGAKSLGHSVEQGDGRRAAVARIAVDLPILPRGHGVVVAGSAFEVAGVAALQVFRVESFRQQNHLLAARNGAQRFGELAEVVDLLFDAGANVLLIAVRELLLALGHLRTGDGGVSAGHLLRRLGAVAVGEIGDEGFVRDLQRIVAAESARVRDDGFDEVAIGGEGGLQTKAVIVVDGADADEIARLDCRLHEITRCFLRAHERLRR